MARLRRASWNLRDRRLIDLERMVVSKRAPLVHNLGAKIGELNGNKKGIPVIQEHIFTGLGKNSLQSLAWIGSHPSGCLR